LRTALALSLLGLGSFFLLVVRKVWFCDLNNWQSLLIVLVTNKTKI